MIIQALVKYYESLLKQQKTVARGWCRAKVAFALELSEDGSLKGIEQYYFNRRYFCSGSTESAWFCLCGFLYSGTED